MGDRQVSWEELAFVWKTTFTGVSPKYLYALLLFSHTVVPDSWRPHGLQHPSFPVLHCLLEFAQTHVHRGDDAIQRSHLLSSLLLLPSIFPSIRVFSNQFFPSHGQSIGVSIPTKHIPSKARSTLCILDLPLEPDRVILSCIIQGSKADLEKIHQQEK